VLAEGPAKKGAGATGVDDLELRTHLSSVFAGVLGAALLGAKSYGRNNTFLLRVGWQQVEEVLALLAPCEVSAAMG
jgi:hypothetical protein